MYLYINPKKKKNESNFLSYFIFLFPFFLTKRHIIVYYYINSLVGVVKQENVENVGFSTFVEIINIYKLYTHSYSYTHI